MRSSDARWLARLVVGLILTLGGDALCPRAYACGSGYDHPADHPDAPAPPGCSGPSCSRPDPTPLPPDAAPRAAAPEAWDRVLPPEHPGHPAPSGWLDPADEGTPAHLASSVFRPPR